MTRFTKNANGSYNVNGKSYELLSGSRAQVWHGTACKTSGGLKKSDLMQNKAGRIVSKAKHVTAKKEKRLVKAGYGTKKGTFGFVKLGVTKTSSRGKGKSRSKTRKGGSPLTPATYGKTGGKKYKGGGGMYALSPSAYDGKGVGTSGADLQIYATTMGGKRSKSKRGGGMYALSPSAYDGKGVGTSGVDLQIVAGNAG
jgi:hypothetical protein